MQNDKDLVIADLGNALEKSQAVLEKLPAYCKNQTDLTDQQAVGMMMGQIKANEAVLKRCVS